MVYLKNLRKYEKIIKIELALDKCIRSLVADTSRLYYVFPDEIQKANACKGNKSKPWQDDKGIQYIGIEQFLIEENWLL